MSRKSLTSLKDRVGQLRMGLNTVSMLDKQSLIRLLAKAEKIRNQIQEVARDDGLLFMAFVHRSPASWIDSRGRKRKTVLSEFLDEDQIQDRIEEKQAEIKGHCENLIAVAEIIRSYIALPRKPGPRGLLHASSNGKKLSEENGLLKRIATLAALEDLLKYTVQMGTGPGRHRGSREANTRNRIDLIVMEARTSRKESGRHPGVSRTPDGKRVYGKFLRRIASAAQAIDWIPTATQIDDKIKLIKRSPDCPSELFSEGYETPESKYSAFLPKP